MGLFEEASARGVLYAQQWLSFDYCLHLIERSASKDMKDRSYQGVVNTNLRNCQYAVLPDEMTEIFLRFAREQLEPFFGICACSDLPFSPVIYRYPVGEGFTVHHDEVTAIERERAKLNNQPVIGGDFTVVLFLSAPDSCDGGELYFPDFNLSFKPPSGSIVAYPATRAYLHGVRPITRGARWTSVCRFFKQIP